MNDTATLTREGCITLADICRKLGKSRRAVYEIHKTGGLPAPVKHPWGKMLLWDKAEVDRFLAEKYPRIFGGAT